MKIQHILLVGLMIFAPCSLSFSAAPSEYETALSPTLGAMKRSIIMGEREISIPATDKRPERRIGAKPMSLEFEKCTIFVLRGANGSLIYGRVDFAEPASIDTVVKVEEGIRRVENSEEIVFRFSEDKRRIVALVIDSEGSAAATEAESISGILGAGSPREGMKCSFEVAQTAATRGFVTRQAIQTAFQNIGLIVVRGREAPTADIKISVLVTGEPSSSTSPGRCVFEYYVTARDATEPIQCRLEFPSAIDSEKTRVALEYLNRNLAYLLDNLDACGERAR